MFTLGQEAAAVDLPRDGKSQTSVSDLAAKSGKLSNKDFNHSPDVQAVMDGVEQVVVAAAFAKKVNGEQQPATAAATARLRASDDMPPPIPNTLDGACSSERAIEELEERSTEPHLESGRGKPHKVPISKGKGERPASAVFKEKTQLKLRSRGRGTVPGRGR